MDFSINEIVEAVRGKLLSGTAELRVTGVSIDSRTVKAGDLFFAIKGPNFDGHAFIDEAVEKGAVAVVVERTGFDLPDSVPLISVEESTGALGLMAAFVRAASSIPLVAVSGTTGKSTTREMIASILSCSRSVLKTEGNKNNLIGLPLTLFRLKPEHKAAVVELGISEPWEMSALVEMAAPDVALITNIGSGHLETLGDTKGVAKAKAALFMDPAPACVRVVNLDDELVKKTFEESVLGRDIKTVTFSLNKPSDVSVKTYSVLEGLGGVDVEYNVKGETVSVRLKSPALCNVLNGAAAIAASLPLGAGIADIKEGLEKFEPVAGRLSVSRVGNVTVIDDTYNANPDSMEAAFLTLSMASGRKVAVVGDMLELGAVAPCAHAAIGKRAVELGIDILVVIGDMADEVIHGALLSGLDSACAFKFSKKETATEVLDSLIEPGDTVLVKASRGVRFETLAEAIKRSCENRSAAL